METGDEVEQETIDIELTLEEFKKEVSEHSKIDEEKVGKILDALIEYQLEALKL